MWGCGHLLGSLVSAWEVVPPGFPAGGVNHHDSTMGETEHFNQSTGMTLPSAGRDQASKGRTDDLTDFCSIFRLSESSERGSVAPSFYRLCQSLQVRDLIFFLCLWTYSMRGLSIRGAKNLGGSSCMVKITPNAPNLDHARKKFFTGSVF